MYIDVILFPGFCFDMIHPHPFVVVMCDNIKEHRHPTVTEILLLLRKLERKGFDIIFSWVPGHVGILGNEQADTAARSVSDPMQQPVCYRDLKTSIQNYVPHLWQETWDEQILNKLHSTHPSTSHWAAVRRHDVRLTRLRIGHTRFTHRPLLLAFGAAWPKLALAPLKFTFTFFIHPSLPHPLNQSRDSHSSRPIHIRPHLTFSIWDGGTLFVPFPSDDQRPAVTSQAEEKDRLLAWRKISNASGSVPRQAVIDALVASGADQDFVALITNIYEDSSTQVLTEEGPNPPIALKSRVKQGCPLSGILFNLASDHVLCSIQDHRAILTFADDLVLLAESPEELQEMI
ncbi:RNase H domain-containing protein [Trichonephila clavipes]|nr:RNase H domain-containing protein [Trichonephila clavipes]